MQTTMHEALSGETVRLAGVRTIRNAEQTRSLLLEALCGHTPVSLDCSAVTEADLSFVQLLLSARMSAQLSGMPVTLAQPAGGALLQALSKAGFAASPDPLAGAGTYWFKGEDDVQDHSCRG